MLKAKKKVICFIGSTNTGSLKKLNAKIAELSNSASRLYLQRLVIPTVSRSVQLNIFVAVVSPCESFWALVSPNIFVGLVFVLKSLSHSEPQWAPVSIFQPHWAPTAHFRSEKSLPFFEVCPKSPCEPFWVPVSSFESQDFCGAHFTVKKVYALFKVSLFENQWAPRFLRG